MVKPKGLPADCSCETILLSRRFGEATNPAAELAEGVRGTDQRFAHLDQHVAVLGHQAQRSLETGKSPRNNNLVRIARYRVALPSIANRAGL